MFQGSEKYISLKEASKISGYSSDYIGQLIRNGKISGKQVYANVAWMTTEHEIIDYMRRREKQAENSPSFGAKAIETIRQFKNRFLLELQVSRVVRVILYVFMGVLLIFALVLFYVFSVNLDKYLERRAVRGVEVEEVVSPQKNTIDIGVTL